MLILSSLFTVKPLLNCRALFWIQRWITWICLYIYIYTLKCGSNRCQICTFLCVGRTFRSKTNGKEFRINYNLNCNSKNVVYLITCKVCGIQYVGSTTTTFRSRFKNRRKGILSHLIFFLTIWRLFANSAIFAKITTFVKSASFKAPLCFVITCSLKFGEVLPFLSIFASACISGHISHINLVTSRNFKKLSWSINDNFYAAKVAKSVNYASSNAKFNTVITCIIRHWSGRWFIRLSSRVLNLMHTLCIL